VHDILRLTMDSTAPAPSPKPRAFFAGAMLVWTRQRVLWWIFAVNLVLAFLGTPSVAHFLADDAGVTLNHSLESSRRLVHGFDLAALAELGSLPEAPLRGMGMMFLVPSFLFTLFMLFMTGGLLVSYQDDLRLDAAGFFEACGRHFWRFVRLLIYFAVVMILVGILWSLVGKFYSEIDDAAVSPSSAPVFMGGATILIILLLICVRIWFDMAQVIAVAKDERRMHRALRRSAALVWNNLGSLFWLYVRISVIGCALFGYGLYIWMMKLRPEDTPRAFVLGQVMILLWLGTRLWRRASETEWYKQYRMAHYAPVPMPPPRAAVPTSEVEVLPGD
jgi:NADH:ubiquinone oxidoreductase subunit 6 (subunit J)